MTEQIYKLEISGKFFICIEAFECYRNQLVVINDYKSSYVRVFSGVLQETILAPVLFLICINDIIFDLNYHCNFYADDCVLYRRIRSKEDTVILQNDLGKFINSLKLEECHCILLNVKFCWVNVIRK